MSAPEVSAQLDDAMWHLKHGRELAEVLKDVLVDGHSTAIEALSVAIRDRLEKATAILRAAYKPTLDLQRQVVEREAALCKVIAANADARVEIARSRKAAPVVAHKRARRRMAVAGEARK